MMKHETRAWCGVTLRVTSRQQKRVHETERRIAHTILCWYELIPFYQRISIIIFKICFSRNCSPSRATKMAYFANFAHPQTRFGCPKLSSESYKEIHSVFSFKFSILFLHKSILFKSWKRKKHKRRSFKLNSVRHFLLVVLL